jgi:crotonobetainyl-CoA:carnitine CoA-transferase CaiB-like acyl-CoA transferase
VTRLLDGVRVLSLAEQYPGPYATLVLADLGADVVLVERPGGGDPARGFGPFFEAVNRGKRSLALDLKQPAGRDALLRLARDADVLLEGYRPGTVDRLGVGYDDVRAVNERIVYVSISGFGQDGPYRDRPAHDASYQATAGLLWERGEAGAAGPSPSLQVGDLSGAMFALSGTLAALFERERKGHGAYVDVSITDGLVSWMTTALVPVVNGLGPPGFPQEPGYALYATADGKLISLGIAHEDWFWRPFCALAGLEDVAGLGSRERVARYDELARRIEAALLTRTRDEWAAAFDAAGVPFGPVNALEEVASDPHVQARGLLVEVPGAAGEPAQLHVRQPLRFAGYESGPTRRAPRLGEHTRELLAEAGLAPAEVEALLAAGAAADGAEAR